MQTDLVILGGGITGVGIARLAAGRGLRVTLVERADLAAGASSASSHMLHGGLRYLEHGQFGLVHQALAERSRVMAMAPHLARPGRFLVPLYAGQRVGLLRLRTGLALYEMLAGRRRLERAEILDAATVRRLEPGVAAPGLRGAGAYSDGLMEDDGLALAVAADATRRGARLLTWTHAVEARPTSDGGVRMTLEDRLGERPPEEIEARVVVNATGAWVDGVRRWLIPRLASKTPDVTPALAPSRGVHLIYPALTTGHGLLFFARSDGRVLFVVPFGGRSLVGTTEVAVASPPADEETRPTVEEIRYLRREVAAVLPGAAALRPLALTTGLRPLLRCGDDVGSASREHAILREGVVVSVAGGKYTTFRVMAADALEAAAQVMGTGDVGGRGARDDDAPLPAPEPGDDSREARLTAAARDPTARRVEDLVRRRTRLWLEEDGGRGALPLAAELLARRDGWDDARRQREINDSLDRLERDDALIRRAEVE